MAYDKKEGLPREMAGKLNHIDIPYHKVVNKILQNMELKPNSNIGLNNANWKNLNINSSTCNFHYIIAIDGSVSIVEDKFNNIKGVFVKVGTLILKQEILNYFKIQDSIDPRIKENIFNNSFSNSVTFIPLTNNLSYKGHNLYSSLRYLIFDSLKENQPNNIETLKYLIYKKWEKNITNKSENFDCPHCNKKISLAYDLEITNCYNCHEEVLVTDFIGFHKNFRDDAETISETIANEYMLVNETLTLFSTIIELVKLSINKNKPELLNSFLFIKDGPLSLNGIYSKLINY